VPRVSSPRVPAPWNPIPWRPPAPEAAATPLGELVHRSRLLGADRAVCNWGGGNTSVKARARDFRGRDVAVLHVKGSGSDLADCTERHFATLLLEPVLELLEREAMSDQEMVDYLAHCALHPGGPRPSIETLLHAFLPARHVDHTHPDAIVALCTAEEGETWAREIYGDEAIWIPYRRPGFALSRQCALALRQRPGAKLILLAKHGLITWGETSEECYRNTCAAIAKAHAFLRERGIARGDPGPSPARPASPPDPELLAWLRGRLSAGARVILTWDGSPATLSFVADPTRLAMAARGAACPDHLVHTGRIPLILPEGAGRETIDKALAEYAERVTAEFRECSARGEAQYPQDPPIPRVILWPGVGLISTGRTKFLADVSRDLAHRAMAVIDLLAAAGATYAPLGPQESHDVQYWPLERYKLTLQPPEREFSRQVALVTGGAGGIGRAIARAVCREGGHVVLADIDGAGAEAFAAELCREFGPGAATGVAVNVTDEAQMAAAFAAAARAYGGVDLVVANAGIASSARLEETTLAEWERNMGVLATGYFLTAREGARLLRAQGLGGCIVFIASKNAVAAGRGIAAYGAAKAAELHLARCLAEELGPDGIRVNVVNPDAVLSGSRIWTSEWRQARARNYGIAPEELPEYYRRRTLLGVNIYPEDVAEAVLFLASRRAAKTTGAMLPVDGGVAGAFPR
jgi:rhamnulose-1-phosphate aldolase/alcohol dehydrogenase